MCSQYTIYFVTELESGLYECKSYYNSAETTLAMSSSLMQQAPTLAYILLSVWLPTFRASRALSFSLVPVIVFVARNKKKGSCATNALTSK